MLLPAGLLHRLNSAQRRALLLHELMHLRRGDHLVRMLELVVGVAFWWLPGIGAIGRHLRACEEACCDAAVTARLPRARRAYAQLLLDVVDFAHPLPRQLAAHATAMSAANNLEQRLRAILDDGRAARGAWPASALAMSLALVALPSGVHCVFADRPPPTAALDDGCGSPAKTLRWTGCDPPAELSAFRCPQF
jgi:beta-lactamase regulating signal transducer with metallopeptidase domain